MSLDLEALETSFDLVAPRGDELVEMFYVRLFAAAPAVKELFAGTDLPRQRTVLLRTLVLLRKALRDLDAIVPALRSLGARHVAYGVRPDHYPVVADALIAAMAEVAGAAWQPRYERAWSAALEVVSGVMLAGANDAKDAAA
jgi:methyl-accepting chemotaxis protein